MSLIRKQFRSIGGACAAAVAVWAVGVGCVTPSVIKTPAPVNDQPTADQAQQLRMWRRSVATIHSGATETGPTCWYYNPGPNNAAPTDFFLDSTMEVFQTLTLPISLIPDYPGRQVVYCGDVLPISYNAMPPLPPEPAMSAGVPDPDPLAAPGAPVLPPMPVIPVEHPPLIVETEFVKPAASHPAVKKAAAPVKAAAPQKLSTKPTTRPIAK